MEKPGDLIFVIFGASGDLTYRKLIPALYALKTQNLLPEKFTVLGVSHSELTNEAFQDKMDEGIRNFTLKEYLQEEQIKPFVSKLNYISLNINKAEDYKKLKDLLLEKAKTNDTGNNYLFYLAVPSLMFEVIAANLNSAGLNKQDDGYKRIIVEKPFGYDYDSAKELNRKLLAYFDEEQIYRIDHYLGKESVQNLFVMRFANGIFEPLWNRNYIHHVEITSAESIGIENRGKYYDSSGALRDMLQNHLLQEVGLMAMEPPSSLNPDAIHNEKLKVLQSLRPIKEENVAKNVIRGQYLASKIRGQEVKSYREENGVNPESRTETYVAMKFYIDNWRWSGVPFYIRTGKRLPTMVNEIVISFKPAPLHLFPDNDRINRCNQLIIRIQPDEGILIKYDMKLPGAGYNVKDVDMDFHYKDLTDKRIPSAYERLLYDAMHCDSTLFLRGDAVEAGWKFVMPVLKVWENNSDIKIFGYPAGTWGPENADELIEEKEIKWRYPCKNLTNEDTYCEL